VMSRGLPPEGGSDQYYELGIGDITLPTTKAGYLTYTAPGPSYPGTVWVNGNPPEPVVLTGITITTPPDKIVYVEGENLDLTGMVVTAEYSDGSFKDVTALVTTDPVIGALLDTVGQQVVAVSYKEGTVTKTDDFSVTVKEPPESVTLDSIKVVRPPKKDYYIVGEPLDLTDMIVMAYFDNGEEFEITRFCTTDPAGRPPLNNPGTQTVIVIFDADGDIKTDSFDVEVGVPVTLESISITTPPNRVFYWLGNDLDITGMVVKATYSDGSMKVIRGYTVSPPDGSTLNVLGTQVLLVSYTEGGITKTASCNVEVEEETVTLDSIAVTKQPDKVSYLQNENLDLTGMVVTATYSNGVRKDVTVDTVRTPDSGEILPATGMKIINVSYTEGLVTKTAMLSVTVSAKVVLAGIEVTQNPNKMAYDMGDNLELTGMVVTALYSDGSAKALSAYSGGGNGYTTDPAVGAVLNAGGQQAVTVSYTEDGITRTASVVVTVSDYTVSGEIIIGANRWDSFDSGVAFDMFFKDNLYVFITAKVGDGSGSDNAAIEYYVSQTALSLSELQAVTGWQSYVKYIELTPNNKYIVYAKLTGPRGDPVYINTGGLVLFTDSQSVTDTIEYVLGSGADQTAEVMLNDNTIRMVVRDVYVLDAGTAYSVSGEFITFKADKLEDLEVGEYWIAVFYNPLGMEYVSTRGNASPDYTAIKLIVTAGAQTAPEITGPTEMTLTEGYAATSTAAYTITGTPPVTVTLDSANSEITWNDTTKTIDIAAGLTTGDYIVELTASNGTTPDATLTFTLTVETPPVILESIAVTTMPDTVTYTEGETLDLTGMVVTVYYSDGSSKPVTGYTTDPVDGVFLGVTGDYQIDVSYTEDGVTKTCYFNVRVFDAPKITLTEINVTTMPQTTYIEGDTLDLTGMVVTATYSDGSSKPVTGYTTDPVDGVLLGVTGDHQIDVSYTEDGVTKTCYFNVRVSNAPVTFIILIANGTTNTVTTTALTLTFDRAISGLSTDNITLTGATKGMLSGTGAVYTLGISGTWAEGANVTVAVASPDGYTITPTSLSTTVHRAGVTVTFKPNTTDDNVAGPTPTDKQVTYDAIYGTLATISRIGFTFSGWYLNAEYTGDEVTAETVVKNTDDHDLYAKWTKKNGYTVVYDTGDETLEIGNKTGVAWTDADLLPTETITNEGYELDGWYTEPNGEGFEVTDLTTYSQLANNNDEIMTVEIYANWVVATTGGYKIYYSNLQPAPINMTLTGGSVVRFYATLDGKIITSGIKWLIADARLATVNANGLVSINKKKYTGQVALMLYSTENKLLDSITLRII